MSTNLQLVPTTRLASLEPANIGEALKVAGLLVKSGAIPQMSEASAFAIIASGRELGLGMMESFRCLYILNGKVGMYAWYMLARAKQCADCDWIKEVKISLDSVTYETKTKAGHIETETYAMDDYTRSGNKNPTYAKQPKAMLRARCQAALVRRVYPEALSGMYVPEEFGEPAPKLEVIKGPLNPQPIIDDPLANAPKAPVSDVEVVRPWQKAGETGSWSAPFEAELSVVTTTEGAQEIGKRIGAYVKAHGLEDDPTTAILRRVLKDSLDDIRRNPE